ncbi:efflux RND transporter permease subunit, partial [Streptomyces galilaeus]
DLNEAISAANRNDGAGRLVEGEKALVVRAEGALATTQDIERIVVKVVEGKVLRIEDIAKVTIGGVTRYGAVTRNATGEAV